jgi:hypothetical protein
MLARVTLHNRNRDEPHVHQWRARQQHLDQLLGSNHHTDWHWLWSIRKRVLRFLMNRYNQPQEGQRCITSDAGHDPKTSLADSYQPATAPPESVEPYASWQPGNTSALSTGSGKPIRAGESFRRITNDLAQANSDRHIECQIEFARAHAEEARRIDQAQQTYIAQQQYYRPRQGQQTTAIYWQNHLSKLYLLLAYAWFVTAVGCIAPLIAQSWDPNGQYHHLNLLVLLIPLSLFLLWHTQKRITRLQGIIQRIAKRPHPS